MNKYVFFILLIIHLNIIFNLKYSKFGFNHHLEENYSKKLIQNLFYFGSAISPLILNLNNSETSNDDDINYEDYKNTSILQNKLYNIIRRVFGEVINDNNTIMSDTCKILFNEYLLSNKTVDELKVVSNYYIKKLIEDSSKHPNDLGTYEQCKYNPYNRHQLESNETTDLAYVILTLDKSEKIDKKTKELEFKKGRLDFDQVYYVRAFCLPQANESEYKDKNCSANDYLNFINALDDRLSYSLGVKDVTETRVFVMEEASFKKSSFEKFKIFLKLIPFFLCIFHVIIVIFRSFIIFLFYKYYEKKKQNDITKNTKLLNDKENKGDKEDNDENEEDDDEEDYKLNKEKKRRDTNKEKIILPDWIKIFNKCFNFVDNFKELFNFSLNSTIINNDSGLFYIRGLKASFLFLLIFGLTFLTMMNGLSKIMSNTLFYEFINSFFYLFFFIGLRYSPRIIFSCSGYTFAYKYLCYINKNNLTYLSFFKFILYQIHKYLILIAFFIFERYTLHEMYFNNSPFWEYLNNYILKQPESGRVFLSFFSLSSIFTDEEKNSRYYQSLIDYFWLPYNEIFFFLMGLIIMTIGYKYKLRIDYFLIISTLVIFISKILYSYLKRAKNDELYYATLYYYLFDYGKFMINPIFNLSSYIIGMYFGLINYAVQKGITSFEENNLYNKNGRDSKNEEEKELKLIGPEDKKVVEEDEEDDIDSHGPINDDKYNNDKNENIYREEIKEMPFLLPGILITKWLRVNRIRLIVCLILLLILFFICVHYCALYHIIGNDYGNKQSDLDELYYKCEKIYNQNSSEINDYSEHDEAEDNCDLETSELSKEIQNLLLLEKYITNKFLNFIFRIDIEIVVILLQTLLFILYFKGQNFINNFYCHVFWAMLNKSYFSFILVASPMILFIFYQSETKMLLNLYNLLLYSLISGCLVFLCSSFCYLFFELPYKKLIHILFSDKFKEHDPELEEDDELKEENSDEKD